MSRLGFLQKDLPSLREMPQVQGLHVLSLLINLIAFRHVAKSGLEVNELTLLFFPSFPLLHKPKGSDLTGQKQTMPSTILHVPFSNY